MKWYTIQMENLGIRIENIQYRYIEFIWLNENL